MRSGHLASTLDERVFSFFCFQQKKQRTLPTAGNPQRLMKEYFLSFASNKRKKQGKFTAL